MAREFWKVEGEILTPGVLKNDPDKYGGLGMHMVACIGKEIVTIPLKFGCQGVSIPVSKEDSERIIKDGGVDIEVAPF